MARGIDDYFLD